MTIPALAPDVSTGPGKPRRAPYASQRVAYPFFFVSALLFFLQVMFGLIMAAQYVWPIWLMDGLPFNMGRASHLNLLIFWLLLALMGATYYLVTEETESELYSTRLAYLQLGVMALAGLGTVSVCGSWAPAEASRSPSRPCRGPCSSSWA